MQTTSDTDQFLKKYGAEEWKPHPAYAGVAMRTLVCGDMSAQQMSVHLVHLEPDACIQRHTHPQDWELHAVTSGSGTCICSGQSHAYTPGRIILMPVGQEHEVLAGNTGLTLLAVFLKADRPDDQN